MTRPACWNRPPAADGAWMMVRPAGPGTRAVYRWVRRWFVDRCATWDVAGGRGEVPYPVAHRWDCSGCRLWPVVLVEEGGCAPPGAHA